jgi:hypothetical protein
MVNSLLLTPTYSLAASNVGALSRGPRELRERVGGAEAAVASTTTRSLVNAIGLPNASAKVLLKWLFSMARMHYRK